MTPYRKMNLIICHKLTDHPPHTPGQVKREVGVEYLCASALYERVTATVRHLTGLARVLNVLFGFGLVCFFFIPALLLKI